MDEQQNNPGINQELIQPVDMPLQSEEGMGERSAEIGQAVEAFQSLEVDDRLAVFYYLYRIAGPAISKAAPDDANRELTQEFFAEFDKLPHGEAQLEAMRSLVRGEQSPLASEYLKLTETLKLAAWFLIAERTGGDVIGIPESYQLSFKAKRVLELARGLDFEQQIQFLAAISNG